MLERFYRLEFHFYVPLFYLFLRNISSLTSTEKKNKANNV